MEESEAIKSLEALVPFVMITFIIVIGVILLNQRFRKNLHQQQLEQEKERLEYQHNILQTTIQVQEDERERFAKDLHDELGAMLSIAKHWLHQLENQQSENRAKLVEVRQLIETILASTRRISHDLMPLQLESMGLEHTLRSLAHRAENTGKVTVSLNLTEDLDQLNNILQLSIYRICSELINNSLKYASADHLELEIVKEDEQLTCHYADNGVGIELNKFNEGLGLRSMENRANAIKGTFKYGNRSEQSGFFATLTVPI